MNSLNVYILLIMLFLNLSNSQASEVIRPRGVSLIKASLYDASQDFRCLDGSGTVPFRYINDDYCDCRDGSDEPGTSACPNGLFHCANIGHAAIELRSSRVNDGVCDCCDASDEWAAPSSGGEKTPCSDVCLEMGRAAREEMARKEEETKRGYTLKLGLVEQGKNMKLERESRSTQLRNDIDAAEALKVEREAIKLAVEEPESAALESYREADRIAKEAEDQAKEAERLANEEESVAEAKEVFDSLDEDGDGQLAQAELQQDTVYDTNRDGHVSEDEAAFYLQQSDSVDFDTFRGTSWKLMRPAYLFAKKRQAAEDKASSLFTPPSTPPPPPPPPPSQEPEEMEAPTRASFPGYRQEDEEEEELAEFDDDPLDEEEEEEEEEETGEESSEGEAAASEVEYDPETQALVDAATAARTSYQEAVKEVNQLSLQLTAEEDSLNRDYGPDDEFRTMEGQCYDYTDREYTYQLCPFDKATQSPKSGGGETKLGSWGEWVEDDSEPRYSAMKYTNGQGCWNGPNRSTKVLLHCGVDTQLLSATEPSKCEYMFTFSTPAACQGTQEQLDANSHTEL